jgi:hypothetical protein
LLTCAVLGVGKKRMKAQKNAKQTTLDNLPKATATTATKLPKQITITQIGAETREDELELKIAFKMYPSKTAFSKIKSELSFDGHPINSVLIRIPQGPLATDECEYATVLDMKGIAAGVYAVGVEMYELWETNQKLYSTLKQLTVDYVPQTRQMRLVKVPTVKRVAGADLAVVSETEKDLYEEIEKTQKKEQLSKRDNW